MCLSTVYELGMGETRKKLREYVSSVSVSGNTLTLTDIMGEELVVTGSLRSVDLVNNSITIDAGERK
jgi:predicted RNA-binding protein